MPAGGRQHRSPHGRPPNPAPLSRALSGLRRAGRIPQRAVHARRLPLLPEHRGAQRGGAVARGQDGGGVRRPQPAAAHGERPCCTGRAGAAVHADRAAAVQGRHGHVDRVERDPGRWHHRHAGRGQRGLRVHAAHRSRAGAACSGAFPRGRHHGDQRRPLQRGGERAGAPGVRAGESCPSCRRWASLSRWWNCAANRARCCPSTIRRRPRGWSVAAPCGWKTCACRACGRSRRRTRRRASSAARIAARRCRWRSTPPGA